MLLVVLILLILMLGGGYGWRNEWGPNQFGGLLGTVLVIVLILWLLGMVGSGPHIRL